MRGSRSVATIEEVFLTKIEGFTGKVRLADDLFQFFPNVKRRMEDEQSAIMRGDSETIKLCRFVEYHNGKLIVCFTNDTKTRVPISAKIHVLKNEAKVATSSQHAGILKSDPQDVFSIYLPIDSTNTDQLVDQNGTLTIRIEVTILPCCLSMVGGKRPYKPELHVAAGPETVEKKIRANALDSLAIDMSSLRDKAATENFSDLTISCQGKTFPVHKAILSARSNVFAAMLMHDTKEAKEQRIEIEDVDPDTMEIFLEYIYGSKLPCLDKEQAYSLMIMGDKYNVGTLMQACQLYLLNNLQASNLVQVAILGYLVKDEKLKNAAISKMSGDVGPLRKLQDWSKLRNYPDLALDIADQVKK